MVFYRKLAEIVGQYLKKGSQVCIEGSIRTRKWQGQDGQDRYTTEIEASEMRMLGSARAGASGSPTRAAPTIEASTAPGRWKEPGASRPMDPEEDFPF